MAKSKDDIKYATAQAKLSEDEALRVRYKSGTPLEGGKIADSDPVDLFVSARNISSEQRQNEGVIAESEPVDVFSSARNLDKKQEDRPDQDSDDRSQLGS